MADTGDLFLDRFVLDRVEYRYGSGDLAADADREKVHCPLRRSGRIF